MHGYVLSSDPAHLDGDRVFAWLSGDAYWALDRPREIVERSHAGSLALGAFRDDGRGMPGEQVGIARAVTDRATFAWICDVYIAPECRGKGLGGWLVRSLIEQLEGQGVTRMLLATRDAHDVYARLGFEPLAHPVMWMERDRRAIRPTPPTMGGPP